MVLASIAAPCSVERMPWTAGRMVHANVTVMVQAKDDILHYELSYRVPLPVQLGAEGAVWLPVVILQVGTLSLHGSGGVSNGTRTEMMEFSGM